MPRPPLLTTRPSLLPPVRAPQLRAALRGKGLEAVEVGSVEAYQARFFFLLVFRANLKKAFDEGRFAAAATQLANSRDAEGLLSQHRGARSA